MLYPHMFNIDETLTCIRTKCDAPYDFFMREIVNGGLTYNSKQISFKRWAEIHGMHRSFWHAVTDRANHRHRDEYRIFCADRCKKIGWIKSALTNSDTIVYEEHYRGNTVRINIMLERCYIVVLEKRPEYYLFITGFPIKYNRKIQDVIRNHQQYIKQGTPI